MATGMGLWSSIALLEKGKLPFFRMPLGDHRHTSCHARTTTSGGYKHSLGFKNAIEADVLSMLLSPIFAANVLDDVNRYAAAPHHSPIVNRSYARDLLRPKGSLWPMYRTSTASSITVSITVSLLSRLISKSLSQRPIVAYRHMRMYTSSCLAVGGVGCQQPSDIGRTRMDARMDVGGDETAHTSSTSVKFFCRFRAPLSVSRSIRGGRRNATALFFYTAACVSPPKDSISIVTNGETRCMNSGDLLLNQVMIMDALLK